MAATIVKATELAGAGNYPANRLNKRERKVLETAEEYAPAVAGNWGATPPTTLTGALNSLAATGVAAANGMSVATAVYDFATLGGAVSTISLGVALPNKAVVVEVIRDEITACTSTSSTGTIQLVLPTDGALEQTALTADGGSVTLASSGGSSVPKKTTAARNLSVTIATNAVLAGKIRYFVRYYVSE